MGHGHRPHRDVEIRHARFARVLRSRRALAIALRFSAARLPHARRGIERMKFTLSWLKEHLDTSASLAEIVDKLTMIGLEVERVEDKAKQYEAFKVAQIISAEQHPNADRLRVCQVDNGSGKPLQIVCGAPNARAGLKTVLGLPGTYIPAKNITLSVGKIRDVESQGMMISGAEIGFNEDHSGIIEMPADAPIGKPFAEVLGIAEPVIEINLTPN